MRMIGQDSLKTRRTLTVDGKTYHYFSLPEAAKSIGDVSRLPFSLKVLLENVLRYEDGRSYTVDDAKAIAEWAKTGRSDKEVPFRPARILMQDFTGVPAVVDLAAMRDGIIKLGGDPRRVNPLVPVDLVIDHSVMVDVSGTPSALRQNVEFYGAGLDDLPLADRATIGNMAPEYGATCGFFPVDAVTIGYLRLSGRDEHRIKLVEAFCKAQ